MKGYKAFEKGLICKGKQYAENTVFEEENAEICKSGMHFCKSPFDTLNYYPIIGDDGNFTEFAEVESLEEPLYNGKDKFCTKKLKIGAKLDFTHFIKAGIEFIIEKTSKETESGYSAQIGSSGNYAKIGSSGYSAQIGSSGDSAQIGSSGNYAKIGSSGNYAKIGSSGDYAKIGSSGNYAQIGSSGDSAQIGSSGDSAQIGSSGNYAKIGSSGKDCVICCAGHGSIVKAKKGSWITLSEWEYNEAKNRYVPKCVKTEYVDGERIKEDTFYKLKNGEFVELQSCVDGGEE